MIHSYRLGDFRFQIQSSDQHLSNCIGLLLEQYDNPNKIDVDKDPLFLIDIDLPLDIIPDWRDVVSEASGLEIVRLIVRRALNYHQNYLWFDAATLVSTAGKVVLIAGASHSGKSTASAALAFGLGWKIIAEDVSLVEPRLKQLTTFASPISLRAGSLERIQKATGVLPGPVVGGEWVPINDHLNKNLIDFNVDLSIELAVTDPSVDETMVINEVTGASFIHTLLPLCNAIHLQSGIDLLDGGLKHSKCFRITGGSLAQRLTFISEQVGEPTAALNVVQQT